MAAADYERIVATLDQPTLVLAGPGAGKTHLLGDRVKRLLKAGVEPGAITVLTFGRDASQHMRNKLLDRRRGFGIPYASLPQVCTLHSLGLEIVNRKPHAVQLRKTGLQVQADENVKRLLYRDAALIQGRTEKQAHRARECKQSGDCSRGKRNPECSICEKYWQIMSKCNCIDFDDQVLSACEILEGNPSLLKEFQGRCQHLLVDEYQDINAAQFRLIRLLSKNHPKGLFAVGDDAQSIYGFRGADPKFILGFASDFPGAQVSPLPHSRRCHEQTMCDAERVLKEYYPAWTGPQQLKYHVPAGEEALIWHVPTERREAQWAARICRQAVGEGKTVLILVPKKGFFPAISKALCEYGVPHACPMSLLQESVNRRLQVVFRLTTWVVEPNNSFLTRLAIEALIDHGAAKVPGARKGSRCRPETIRRRVAAEMEIARLWEEVERKRNLLAALGRASRTSRSLQLIADTLDQLRQSHEDCKGKLRGEFAKRLSLAAGVWAAPARLVEDLRSIMQLVAGIGPAGFGAVQLMTMRKAKGLDADVVVMVGLEDDIIPSPASSQEEQARLFYVSMTRAREKLYLLHSYKRPRNISFGPEITKKKRSRFLESLGRPSRYLRSAAPTS